MGNIDLHTPERPRKLDELPVPPPDDKATVTRIQDDLVRISIGSAQGLKIGDRPQFRARVSPLRRARSDPRRAP